MSHKCLEPLAEKISLILWAVNQELHPLVLHPSKKLIPMFSKLSMWFETGLRTEF